jgi:radical SAM protein with 4Fe4S-binding SPASM domain
MDDRGYTTLRDITRESMWGSRSPLLSRLDIELTERCNNACIHCYINLPEHDTKAQARELTTEQWKDVLRQAAELGVLTVRFTGGEPLLREDFHDLYLFTRRLGIRVMLFTNARLITPDLADLFARVPPREKIEITVYGMHPESYDTVACSPGAYVKFRRGVELLADQRVPFVLKSVQLPANKSDLSEMEAWAASLPWADNHLSHVVFLDLRARRDSEAKNRLIASLRLTPDEGVDALAQTGPTYRLEMTDFCSKFMRPPGEMLFSCGAGYGACIDAYGVYQVCLPLRHPDTVYDLRTGSLRQAVTEFAPRVRQMKATNPDYLARCARCFLKGLCEQCPGKSWTEHGTLDTPVEYLCQVAHAQARYLGLLRQDEQSWTVTDWQARVNQLAEGEKGT